MDDWVVAFCDSHVCIEQLDGFMKDWAINVKEFLNVIDLEERSKVLSYIVVSLNRSSFDNRTGCILADIEGMSSGVENLLPGGGISLQLGRFAFEFFLGGVIFV